MAVVLCLLVGSPAANAALFDLTTAGSSATINGAVLSQQSVGSGTGLFPSFVQNSSNNSATSAYNTIVNGVLDNGSDDPHNHAITIGDLTTTSDGLWYVFAFDSNQGNDSNLISLDEIRIFAGGTANNSTTTVPTDSTVAAFGDLVYRFDAGGDNTAKLSPAFSSGSGTSDYVLFVPVAFFGTHATNASDQVIFYSAFGGDLGGAFPNTSGPEEWANKGFTAPSQETLPTPEPASFLAWSLGLAICGGARASRRFRRKS
jgi:hypothetical protein